MVREILIPNEAQVLIKIPTEYINHKIEVLAFPVPDMAEDSQQDLKQKAIAFGRQHKAFDLNWSGSKLSREEMNER